GRIARECCRADGRAPKSFWDLCCGSMAVSIAMPRCAQHHAIDLDDDLINLARIIKDPIVGPKFYRTLRRVINHEGLFYESKLQLAAELSDGLFGDAPMSDFDRAVAYFIVSWQGRNGVAGTERTNYQPAIRWTSGGGHGATRFKNAVTSIPAWRRRMRDIFQVLSKIEDQDGTSIYIDPPYLRTGARSGSCKYKHEFQPADHEDLHRLLSRFEATRVVVSYYDDPPLREWYDGWTFVDCSTQKNLHVQNRRGAGRCVAPEVLVINGPSFTEEASHGNEDAGRAAQ
ncbi:MAG: hypothetical protein GC159_12745, partial [Phycisphaera sp.]|nr:hypothetical protein [Phycisphaera sp.]